jgi:predicted nicotinamide N-methyase
MDEFRGYRVHWEPITLSGRTFELLMPVAPDDLLDNPRVAARFEHDEYLPYWATLWPAALLLAENIAMWPFAPRHPNPPTVLELGCGLGLVGLVALQLGYRVILSDYDEDALAFARASATRNGLPEPETRSIDWRLEYDDLRPDRILAADVLYEARNLRPIAQFIRTHLAPGGVALVSDAQRSTADTFAAEARAAGLDVHIRSAHHAAPAAAPWLPNAATAGRIFELRRAAS